MAAGGAACRGAGGCCGGDAGGAGGAGVTGEERGAQTGCGQHKPAPGLAAKPGAACEESREKPQLQGPGQCAWCQVHRFMQGLLSLK